MSDHDFSADRPISDINEDLLGRGPFAESLARAIAGWHGKDSLVIALHGDWGSGKSSVKNMVLSAFDVLKIKAPRILSFNPWEWAAQDKIIKAFFEELARAVGQKDKNKTYKNLAKRIKLYGQYLDSGACLATGFSGAFPTLFLLLTVFGIGGVLANSAVTKSICALLVAITAGWAAFLKWGSSILSKLSGIAEEHAKHEELSLEAFKKSLARDLEKLTTPILVIIDDIDRLTSDETKLVFQLVKANADFPNIVYLLLFQRDITESKLTDDKQSGRLYLEKIIQVPFDIPSIEQTKLEKILFSSLDRILEADPIILKRFDQRRWENVYIGGLRSFFKTLRNTYRFSSTLSFYVTLLKGERAFEVNPVDLIAIETLRVFQPDVYKAISVSKALMTSVYDGSGSRTEASKKEIQKILDSATEENRDAVKDIIQNLFPNVEGLLANGAVGSGTSGEWFKDLRVCHSDVFDRYFQFVIPNDALSQSDLEELLELANRRDLFYEKLVSLRDRGLLKMALSQLDHYKQDISLEFSDSFIPALIDIGDFVEDDFAGFTGFSSHTYLVRIVLWYLRQENSPNVRAMILFSAFEKSSGLSVVARLLAGDEERRKKNQGETILLDDASFESAKIMFIDRVRSAAHNDSAGLLRNKFLPSVLFRWSEWGDPAEPQEWVRSVVNNWQDLLLLLDGFAATVASHSGRDHAARISYRILLESVERFIPLDTVRNFIKDIDTDNLSDRQKQVLGALVSAVSRRDKGLADDSFDD